MNTIRGAGWTKTIAALTIDHNVTLDLATVDGCPTCSRSTAETCGPAAVITRDLIGSEDGVGF